MYALVVYCTSIAKIIFILLINVITYYMYMGVIEVRVLSFERHISGIFSKLRWRCKGQGGLTIVSHIYLHKPHILVIIICRGQKRRWNRIQYRRNVTCCRRTRVYMRRSRFARAGGSAQCTTKSSIFFSSTSLSNVLGSNALQESSTMGRESYCLKNNTESCILCFIHKLAKPLIQLLEF